MTNRDTPSALCVKCGKPESRHVPDLGKLACPTQSMDESVPIQYYTPSAETGRCTEPGCGHKAIYHQNTTGECVARLGNDTWCQCQQFISSPDPQRVVEGADTKVGPPTSEELKSGILKRIAKPRIDRVKASMWVRDVTGWGLKESLDYVHLVAPEPAAPVSPPQPEDSISERGRKDAGDESAERHRPSKPNNDGSSPSAHSMFPRVITIVDDWGHPPDKPICICDPQGHGPDRECPVHGEVAPVSPRINFLQHTGEGICFVHGPYKNSDRSFGCPKWPTCQNEPQKPEYVAMGQSQVSNSTPPLCEVAPVSPEPPQCEHLNLKWAGEKTVKVCASCKAEFHYCEDCSRFNGQDCWHMLPLCESQPPPPMSAKQFFHEHYQGMCWAVPTWAFKFAEAYAAAQSLSAQTPPAKEEV